jgi:uncharacterized protein (DUF427 family)
VLAESIQALRVLETSHPPTIYIPPGDVRFSLLTASDAAPTWCEFKGKAQYLDAILDGRRVRTVAWSYAHPTAGYEALRDYIAFYPGRMDAAWLDGERVQAQPGDFYGGGSPAIWSARSKGRLAPAAGSDSTRKSAPLFPQRRKRAPKTHDPDRVAKESAAPTPAKWCSVAGAIADETPRRSWKR